EPEDAAEEKQPAEQDRDREPCYAWQDDGNRAEYGERDPFDQKEHPVLADRAEYLAARLLQLAFDRGHGGISCDCATQECQKSGYFSNARSMTRLRQMLSREQVLGCLALAGRGRKRGRERTADHDQDRATRCRTGKPRRNGRDRSMHDLLLR